MKCASCDHQHSAVTGRCVMWVLVEHGAHKGWYTPCGCKVSVRGGAR